MVELPSCVCVSRHGSPWWENGFAETTGCQSPVAVSVIQIQTNNCHCSIGTTQQFTWCLQHTIRQLLSKAQKIMTLTWDPIWTLGGGHWKLTKQRKKYLLFDQDRTLSMSTCATEATPSTFRTQSELAAKPIHISNTRPLSASAAASCTNTWL